MRGEVPVAYVVLKGAIEPWILEERCREKLASFKVPRAFHLVEKAAPECDGKIQKHLLGP